MLYMDDQTNLRYTFLREKYKNIGGCKKCKRYKCLNVHIDLYRFHVKWFEEIQFEQRKR